jgi:hypothetical protein
MPRPEDTSKRDPLLHLAFAWPSRPGDTESASRYITDMEAQGQRELVASDRLPTDLGLMTRNDPEAYQAARQEYEALGFQFGDPDPDDPLFMPAKLPDGWRREGSDHAMWSYLLDQRGLRRVAVFYKAAFYDRKAHMTIVRVGGELASKFLYWQPGDGPAPEIPWDKLTAEEVSQVQDAAEHYLADHERHPDIYDRAERARELLRQVPTGRT